MASVVYPKFKEALLQGDVDLTSVDVKCIAVDTADYTYSSAHDFLDDVPGGAIVATSPNLGSKTVTNGVFDAADTSFTAVTGDQFEAVILYVDSGSSATSYLIAYIDSGSFPTTPNGADIIVTWDNGSNKIFSI